MPRFFRFAAAALVLAGGGFHLSLYLDGYSNIPRIGVVFLLNAVAAVVLATAFALRPLGAVAMAAVSFSAATMIAFVLSRTTGLLGFKEMGWDTRSASTFAIEALSLAVIGIWFSSTRPKLHAIPVIGPRRAGFGSAA